MVSTNSSSERLEPILVDLLRRRLITVTSLVQDGLAGLVVAIVAFPLAMVFAMASGLRPEQGILTVVVGGAVAALLSGSRYQVSGPSGSFLPVLLTAVATVGERGLVVATLMAGMILIAFAMIRLGSLLKYIPYPVIVGFGACIGVLAIYYQIPSLLGIEAATKEVVRTPWLLTSSRWSDVLVTVVTAILMSYWQILVRSRALLRQIPGSFVALIGGMVVAYICGAAWGQEPVSISNRYGGVSLSGNFLTLHEVLTLGVNPAVIQLAGVIAFLIAIESLLAAVVADGMTGERHRSHMELAAQGCANAASAIVGGMPLAGVVARTTTNVRSGAKTPLAGLLHAVFLLALVLCLSKILGQIPLAGLSAILLVVAWKTIDIPVCRRMLQDSSGERYLFLVTFVLGVALSPMIGIGCGLALSAFLFMRRMEQAVQVQAGEHHEAREFLEALQLPPENSAVFSVRGPLFFAAAERCASMMANRGVVPGNVVIDLTEAGALDSTSVRMMTQTANRLAAQGARVYLVAVDGRSIALLRAEFKLAVAAHGNELPKIVDFAALV